MGGDPRLPLSAAHPFYARLNQILDEADFDGYVERLCQQFYADEIGRPGLPPGRYFRLLLIGYFEGLGHRDAHTRGLGEENPVAEAFEKTRTSQAALLEALVPPSSQPSK